MKKTLNILLGGLLVVLLISCDQKTSTVDAQVLKHTVQSSQEFKDYRNATEALMQGAASGEISFKGVDQTELSKKLKESKSAEEYAAHCERLGVKGSQKYAELLFLQSKSMREIAKNHPDLKKLSRKEFSEIINPNIQLSPEPGQLD